MKQTRKKNNTLILIISLLLILVPTLYFGLVGRAAEMGVALAAGALSAAFLNFDKFQSFKGAGIEFELKKAVEEAYATMEHVKAISEPLFISSIKMMTEGHTFDGIPEADQHRIVSMIGKVTENNLASDEVKSAVEGFYKFNLRYKYRDIIEYNSKDYSEISKRLAGLMDDEASVFPTGNQIRQVLNELPIIPAALEELIQDYIFYKENRYPKSRS